MSDSIERQLEACPPVVRDWILSQISSPGEITDLYFSREILPDGYENGWVKQKPGPHMTVTVVQNMRVDRQSFVKDDVHTWAIANNHLSTITWKQDC